MPYEPLPGALVAAQCQLSSGGGFVYYYLYDNDAAMNSQLNSMRPSNISLRQGSCEEYDAAEGPWNQYGVPVGEMHCFVDPKGAARLQWTKYKPEYTLVRRAQ